MVHALEKTRGLLQPGGILLNVHDIPQSPRLEIHGSGHERYAGLLLSRSDFENQRLADEALDQAVREGFFVREDVKIFEYLIHADTFEALNEMLEETWETAYIPQGTVDKIVDFMRAAGEGAEIILRMPARITKLRPTREGA
jgi:hypothetical protein